MTVVIAGHSTAMHTTITPRRFASCTQAPVQVTVAPLSRTQRARLDRGKDESFTLDLSCLATAFGPAAHDTGGAPALVGSVKVHYTPVAFTPADWPEPVTLTETPLWRPRRADQDLSDDPHALVDEFVRRHALGGEPGRTLRASWAYVSP